MRVRLVDGRGRSRDVEGVAALAVLDDLGNPVVAASAFGPAATQIVRGADEGPELVSLCRSLGLDVPATTYEAARSLVPRS